ncbi:MAG: hypothetical protein JO116_20105 [Planctomycetaceae bacterium]|nr:hypothetical protein [Planctomycetaceae bacterium]
MSRPYAYQLIDAAKVVSNLSAMADIPLPSNERQIREISGLEPDQQREIWAEAVERSGGRPTAKVVHQVVAEMHPKPKRQAPAETTTEDDEAGSAGQEVVDVMPPAEAEHKATVEIATPVKPESSPVVEESSSPGMTVKATVERSLAVFDDLEDVLKLAGGWRAVLADMDMQDLDAMLADGERGVKIYTSLVNTIQKEKSRRGIQSL